MSACRYCGRNTDAKPVVIAYRGKPEGEPFVVCRVCQQTFNQYMGGRYGIVLAPASRPGRGLPLLSLPRPGRRGPSSSEVRAGAGDPALTELETRYAWGDR